MATTSSRIPSRYEPIPLRDLHTTHGTLNTWKADLENGNAQDGTHVIEVQNNKGALLPETGGMGTVIFTVAGIAIIAGGIAWKRSRRAGNNA